ncbi:MAG: hypothetical protein DLM72_21335 [Candidatus Nitrosopolaris wilkensis]|nr:MAG: hypothetical protein DLM72_21335 [Candidatus Nitrosopolaris wilkensis]
MSFHEQLIKRFLKFQLGYLITTPFWQIFKVRLFAAFMPLQIPLRSCELVEMEKDLIFIQEMDYAQTE